MLVWCSDWCLMFSVLYWRLKKKKRQSQFHEALKEYLVWLIKIPFKHFSNVDLTWILKKRIYIITTLKPINKTNNNLIYNYALQRNAADPFRSLNLCIFAIFIWKDLREKVKPPIWSALET